MNTKNSPNNKGIIYTTTETANILNDVGFDWLTKGTSGPLGLIAKAYSALKNFGLGYGLDRKIGKESKGQAVTSNLASLGTSEAVGAIATSVFAVSDLPAAIALEATKVVAGSAIGSVVDYSYKNPVIASKSALEATALTSPVLGPLVTANKFQSFFNKAKLYVQKNQKADITVPTGNELLNVSNSAAVQQAINQNNAVQVIEKKPAPVVQQDSGAPGWLSSLYDFLNVTNVAVGGTKSVSAYPIIKHTGGKVPGRGDIMAILKGGETVRTEAQEKELQEQMLKKHFESFAPLISGQGNDEQNQQNGAFSSQSEKKSAKPILQDRTRHDEEMIISIVADAWKSNRLGFRRVLKSC